MLRQKLIPITTYYKRSFTTLSYIPHAFNIDEAAKKFVNAEQNRIFAPRQNANGLVQSNSENPLKKVFFPMFGVNANVNYTNYKAWYGADRTVEDTHTDSEGRTTTTYRTYTDWYYVTGSLNACSYHQDDASMRIYAGYQWNPSTIEKTFENETMTGKLKAYNSAAVPNDTHIDPFLMRLGRGLEIGYQRIKDYEMERIERDVRSNAWHFVSRVSIESYSINYNLQLNSCMLPGYILQYSDSLPRVLSAIDYHSNKVYGYAPVSIPKVMSATGIAATLLTIFFPEIAVPVRLSIIAGSTFVSGLWALWRGDVTAYSHENNIKNQQEQNESISETIADKDRFEETSRDFKAIEPTSQNIFIDPKWLAELGLDQNTEITYEKVKEAFNRKIKEQHPDMLGGNNESTHNIIEARTQILNKLAESKGESKRHFSTYRQVKLKEPPRSVPDPNAKELIYLVLDKKDYKAAYDLVKSGKAHPDGHDAGENTLLTEAAKRGDLDAIEFSVNVLKVSPDTSCDCPAHNTALHYAAGNGNIKAVILLLKLGATVNLINSEGRTPLDMAKMRNHQEVVDVLIKHNALTHSTQEGYKGLLVKAHGFFIGYKSSDRMKLASNNKENVIYLPAPKR